MKAIVGLGNPGPRYRNTRHNVGWQVLDCLAERWRVPKPVKARQSEVGRATVDGETVLLVKPLTFMNDSGVAVRALVEKDGIAPQEILVVYDDLDLQFGRIRVRASGSSGGHRGIRSIQQHLGQARIRGAGTDAGGQESRIKSLGARLMELAGGRAAPSRTEPASRDVPPPSEARKAFDPRDFPRIKVGIGRPPSGIDPIEYVLTPFTPDERPVIEDATRRAADAAECWLHDGIEVAMNRFNGM
jgi:peptidyl-tRNA hydrolase, PTH1 family